MRIEAGVASVVGAAHSPRQRNEQVRAEAFEKAEAVEADELQGMGMEPD